MSLGVQPERVREGEVTSVDSKYWINNLPYLRNGARQCKLLLFTHRSRMWAFDWY